MKKAPSKNEMSGGKQNGLQRLTDAALYLVPIIPLVFGTIWIAGWLRLQQCPVGTFLTGSLHGRLQVIGLLATVMLFVFAFRHFILHKTPKLREWLKWKCRHDNRWHEKLGRLWLAFFLASITGLGLAAFSQYCLTDTAIIHRAWPWQPFVSQRWNQVQEIDLACRRGSRGATDLSYKLFMTNGEVLDIGDNLGALDDAYPRIHHALDGLDFIYDTSLVHSDCPLSYADPLRLKP